MRVGIGCHPHNAKFYDDALEEKLLQDLRDPRVAAIGEVGLDYHYDHSSRPEQREAFRRQIRLAHKTGLPLLCICVKLTMMGSLSCKKRDFLKRGYCCIASTSILPFSSHG